MAHPNPAIRWWMAHPKCHTLGQPADQVPLTATSGSGKPSAVAHNNTFEIQSLLWQWSITHAGASVPCGSVCSKSSRGSESHQVQANTVKTWMGSTPLCHWTVGGDPLLPVHA